MAAHDDKTQPIARNLLLAAVTLLAAGYGAAGLARHVAEFGPKVGDIVAFDPAHLAGFDSEARLTVDRPGQDGCEIDLGLLRRSGGSLVLERRGAGPEHVYRAHWAGAHTSKDQRTDCGNSTDVMLAPTDLNALVAAAGGFGADHSSGPLIK
jgi:hypothetical protein